MKTMQGYPNNIRGNGHRKTRTNARPLAKAKQNEGRGEKRATRYGVPLLMFIQRFLLYCCGLFDLCAHDGVGFAVAEDVDMVFVEYLLAIGDW